MNEIVTENDLVKCELNPDIPVLVHRWLKKPTSEEFKNQLLEIRHIYIEKKKDVPNLKWLADTELLGALTTDDENWLEEEWDKLLFEDAGLKVHAVILGNDIFADYSMEEFKRDAEKAYTDKGVKLGVFLDAESAYDWLKEA